MNTINHTRHRINVLIEALPYIQRFNQKLIIIKYGGNAMTDKEAKLSFARDVVLLKQVGMHPVVIHGGGPHISENLRQQGIQTKFIQGIRVTDADTMRVVEETLHAINQELAEAIKQCGGQIQAFGNVATSVIRAEKMHLPNVDDDLGQVGVVNQINEQLNQAVHDKTQIPLIAPIGIAEDGKAMNINADLAAAGVACALQAEKLIFMTSAPGVLDNTETLLTTLNPQQTRQLIDQKIIQTGMLPKVQCAINAVQQNVNAVHIIDGRVQHALLLELLTDEGVGTLIVGD